MIDNKFQEYPHNLSLKLVPFLTIVVMMLFSSCTETKFVENPSDHKIIKAMEEWPDEYYWLIKSGVSSRILGIREEGESLESAFIMVDSLMTQVKQKWSEISVIDSSEKLINYLRENKLSPIAEAIQETLTINLEQEPSGEMHYWLQANAIKDGLIGAYNEIKENTNE
ncbi:MAG: hypothetical protein OQK63_01295 [Ignavibacteriaceae bacterium]|nr:hypothetical protein [Ignavibacteriaceae bacterium]